MSDDQVKVLTCVSCGLPVVAGNATCSSCGTPMGSHEVPYLPRTEARPELLPLFKRWGLVCLVIWVFAGFDLGKTSSIAVAAVSLYYSFKIMRAYFSSL